ASLVYMISMALHLPHDIVWRLTLGFGAVPSASVIYLRRKVPETARFLARIAGNNKKTEEVMDRIVPGSGDKIAQDLAGETLVDTHTFGQYFRTHARAFLSAAVLWFLFDMVGYAGGLFGPSLLAKGIGLTAGTFGLVMFAAFSLPGKILAISLIDRWGRKPLQIWGTVLSALALFAFAIFHAEVLVLPILGMMLYGMNTLFSSMGPGSVSTAGMFGVELAPTKVRSMVQGITVAAGRTGATLTTFVFPDLFKVYGESFAIIFLGTLSILAAILTAWGIPETKDLSLEQSSREDITATPLTHEMPV
ncbi:MAG: MFS transporter, partial [Firmicutes bacterium]|nr:MFS transporter [Bacillota bacterium]